VVANENAAYSQQRLRVVQLSKRHTNPNTIYRTNSRTGKAYQTPTDIYMLVATRKPDHGHPPPLQGTLAKTTR